MGSDIEVSARTQCLVRQALSLGQAKAHRQPSAVRRKAGRRAEREVLLAKLRQGLELMETPDSQ